MTKRELDWADKEAKRLLESWENYDDEGGTVILVDEYKIAQALRSAHRRGMEEAGGNRYCLACPIRAAIKNEEQK